MQTCSLKLTKMLHLSSLTNIHLQVIETIFHNFATAFLINANKLYLIILTLFIAAATS